MRDSAVLGTLVFIAALFGPFGPGAKGQTAATVNDQRIPLAKVSVPMQNMVTLFSKRMGRQPTVAELAELEELRLKCEQWLLCAKIRESVLADVKGELRENGSTSPQKAKALEQRIFTEVAHEDAQVAQYIKTRSNRRDAAMEKRVIEKWEQNQVGQADIEILQDRYRPCLAMLKGPFFDSPPVAEMIERFYRSRTPEEATEAEK